MAHLFEETSARLPKQSDQERTHRAQWYRSVGRPTSCFLHQGKLPRGLTLSHLLWSDKRGAAAPDDVRRAHADSERVCVVIRSLSLTVTSERDFGSRLKARRSGVLIKRLAPALHAFRQQAGEPPQRSPKPSPCCPRLAERRAVADRLNQIEKPMIYCLIICNG